MTIEYNILVGDNLVFDENFPTKESAIDAMYDKMKKDRSRPEFGISEMCDFSVLDIPSEKIMHTIVDLVLDSGRVNVEDDRCIEDVLKFKNKENDAILALEIAIRKWADEHVKPNCVIKETEWF